MASFLRDGVDLQSLGGKTISGDAHFFDDNMSPAKVRQNLDSSKEADKLKGMKWLLAMISKGKEVSEFFPDVVKNVVVKSVEVKKMVYNYLVHYADYDATCREIALLSINSFQKDMSGTNPLIRGLALRVMTSIRVPDVIQIQLLAAKKCASDSSPYVRKCAATSLAKIYLLDPEQLFSLKQILDKLLKDSSTMVLGSAIATLNEICPTSYDLVHRNYRKICHLLCDFDEWSQIASLDLLTRYTRNQFTDPAPGVSAAVRLQAKQRSSSAIKGKVIGNTVKRRVVRKAFYSDEEDELDEEEVEVEENIEEGAIAAVARGPKAVVDEGEGLDSDHRLVLRSSLPLLKSRNAGVVLGVCALHYYCGSHNHSITQNIGKALVRILRNRRELQYVVLSCIRTMAQEHPAIFRPFLSELFVKESDPIFNRILKLEILTAICTKENIQNILTEFQVYIRHTNMDYVCAVIRALGRAADIDNEVAGKCTDGLLQLISLNKNPSIVQQAVVVVRQLIQQNSGTVSSHKALNVLAKLLIADEEEVITEPIARANIVWLIGEYHDILLPVAPDLLRVLALGFIEESTDTKMQILNLAVKLSLKLSEDDIVQCLMTYVLEMSRYDMDTDLRDRSRFLTALMGLAPSTDGDGATEASASPIDEGALEQLAEKSKNIMLAAKLPPVTLNGAVDVDALPDFTVGSLSSLVGHYVSGYLPIENWPDLQPDPSVRDTLLKDADAGDTLQTLRAGSGSKRNDESLTGFYGKEGKNDSSSSSDDSDSGNTSSSSDDSDSSSSDDSSSEEDSNSNSSDSDSESDSDSDSSSEEEEAVRVPISQQNVKTRQTMRRVATGSKKVTSQSASSGADSILADFGGLDLISATPTQSVSSNMTAPVAPGAAFASSIDDLSDIFPPSAPISQPSFDVFGDLGLDPATAPANSMIPTANFPSSQLPMQMGMMGMGVGMGMGMMGANPSQVPNWQQQPQQMMQPQSMGVGLGVGGMGAMGGLMQPTNPTMSAFPPGTGPAMGMSMTPAIGMVSPNKPAPATSASTTDAVDEILSEPKELLSPDLAGGLSVSIVYRFSSEPVAYSGAHCVYFIVKNATTDRNLRRVKITLPTELRHTSFEDIPLLAPGQEIKIPVEVVLTAAPQYRVSIRADSGTFVGLIAPQLWELLLPLYISVKDFETVRSKLVGFNEAVKNFSLSSLGLTPNVAEPILLKRLRRVLNVNVIQGPGIGEMYFASSLRQGGTEQKALFTVTVKGDDAAVKVNCDNALLLANLLDALKRVVA